MMILNHFILKKLKYFKSMHSFICYSIKDLFKIMMRRKTQNEISQLALQLTKEPAHWLTASEEAIIICLLSI
jgi:hypothetical protein